MTLAHVWCTYTSFNGICATIFVFSGQRNISALFWEGICFSTVDTTKVMSRYVHPIPSFFQLSIPTPCGTFAKITPEYQEHPYIFTVNTWFHVLDTFWLAKTQNICDWCSLGPIRGTFVSEKAAFPEKHTFQDDHGIFIMQICLTIDRYTLYSVCSRKGNI